MHPDKEERLLKEWWVLNSWAEAEGHWNDPSYDHEYPFEGPSVSQDTRITVPGQWCGECGCNSCYENDYLCSACRENMDEHGDPSVGRTLTPCLINYGYYSSLRVCDREMGHDGKHMGPLLGSARGRKLKPHAVKCMWAQEGECGVDGCEGCRNGK